MTNDFSFINEKLTEALARQFDSVSTVGPLIAAEAIAPPLKFATNSIAISREMALDAGIVEPTPREQLARDKAAEKWKERRAAAYPLTVAYLAALDAITDQLARSVLDLHHRDSAYYPTCAGCEFLGWEGEPPEWPCSTITTVATHYGIDTPDLIVFEEPK